MLNFGDFVSVALTLRCRFVVIVLWVSCCLGLVVCGLGGLLSGLRLSVLMVLVV